MEYGITIGVVLIFLIMYICTRPKMRETYYKILNEEDYNAQCVEFLKNLPLPKQGGSIVYAKKYVFKIKSLSRYIKRKEKLISYLNLSQN